MIRSLSLAAIGAALLGGLTFAQNPPATPAASPSQAPAGTIRLAPGQGQPQASGAKAPVSDPLFAAAAAIGGLTEVTISQLGSQRATDDELKRFSEQMVQEHTKTNQELMALAARKQIAVPSQPDPRAQFCAQSLAGVTGAEFDRCYAKAQFLVHLDSVETFKAEAERGQDPELKAFAAKWLPHIQEHLRTIQPIAMRYMQEEAQEGGRPHAQPGQQPAQPGQAPR